MRPVPRVIVIRLARPDDLACLPGIERDAGQVFASLGMAAVAAEEPPTPDFFAPYQRDDRCWVAADDDERPVAYLLVDAIDGAAHVEQVSVHPDWARRHIGRRLLGAAEGWAHDRGLRALTLTTFAEVPWNAPYYARLGFHVAADDDVTPGVGRIRDEERARGLDRWTRVVMRRDLPAWAPWTPEELMARLRAGDVPWAVAGGWSLDLFLGYQSRSHEDLEVAVPAAGFPAIRDALAELDFEAPGGADFAESHQTWDFDPGVRAYRVDVFREPHDEDTWVCRRDPSIRLSYGAVVRLSDDGIPYQAPEIGLLFKAKHARPKDAADFTAVVPRLDRAQRRWLTGALETIHPGHPWLAALRAT